MSHKNKKRKYREVLEAGSGLIDFYLQNPCIAAYDLLGVDLAPIQRVVFEDFWFKNYVMAICGRGGGKSFMLGVLAALNCMLRPGYRVGLLAPVFRQSIISGSYDTFWTSDGLQTTTQKFYDSIEKGVTKTQSLESQNTILSKWKNTERACRSIKTTKGFEFGGTVDHGLLVLNDELDLVFKDLQDITKEDNIVVKKGFNYFGNDNSMPIFNEFEMNYRMNDCKIPKKLTPALAYWLGLLTGDGCISFGKKQKEKNRVNFTNNTKELIDSFLNIAKESFDVNLKFIDRSVYGRSGQIDIYNTKLCNYLIKCGMSCTTAYDKCMPYIVKKASRECVISFIRGCYDSDGCFSVRTDKRSKTNTMHADLQLSTVSHKLAKEIQAVLLNLGIFARCEEHNNKNRSIEYKVVIANINEFIKFRDIIGFNCKYKQKLLNEYIDKSVSKYSYHIPNSREVMSNLVTDIESVVGSEIEILKYVKQRYKHVTGYTVLKITDLLTLAKETDTLTEDYHKLKKIIDLDLSFVKMIESDYFFAPTIDVEVENESCYWSNGFISHNSKMIFAEVEKLYAQSSLLREACDKPPTRGSDVCYLRFKSVGGRTPSYIEALPLGADGSKIRGSRFYLLLIDEFAQMPSKIIDTVLMPMGATSLAPMERVRRLEQKARLLSLGLASEDDFEQETVNKMIMTSSGFYKFNHMWKRMKDHWGQEDLAEKENIESQYAVWQVPYWDLPEGFLDQNNVDEAKRVMSSSEFRMEYEAEMVSDSEGFFKASLLEECSIDSGFTVELRGDHRAQYIIGVDPNQGGRASCGIVILRVGSVNKIVRVLELKTQTTQQLTQLIQDFCEKLNVIRVFMDKGGGGKAVCDLLEEGYGGKQPIIDRTNDDHRHLPGSHILEMIYFNPNWIADANFTTKAMLEAKNLLFPEPPIGATLDIEAAGYDTINTLKSQMLNIIVTQTSTGILHFDTPQKGQNKDLYSALLLSAHGARMVEKELEGDGEPILFNSSGYIRPHDKQGASFDPITSQGGGMKSVIPSAAILKKKFK